MLVGVLAKIKLVVLSRRDGHGCYIASVPVKELVRLCVYRKRRWFFEGGWLVLEAF